MRASTRRLYHAPPSCAVLRAKKSPDDLTITYSKPVQVGDVAQSPLSETCSAPPPPVALFATKRLSLRLTQPIHMLIAPPHVARLSTKRHRRTVSTPPVMRIAPPALT